MAYLLVPDSHRKEVLMEKDLNIRIGHLKIIDHLILGYSMSRLQTHGNQLSHSTLENVPMNSWEQIGQGLITGDIDGAFISAPLAMDLFAAGLEISFLMFVHRSGSLMVRHKESPIKTLSDLGGKSILIPHALSVQHLLLHKLLAAAGLNLSYSDQEPGPLEAAPLKTEGKILAEFTNPFLMPQMLENDKDLDIGAYMVAEPFGSVAIARGTASKLCTSDSLWKDHPCCGFVIKSDLVSSRGKAIEELVHHFFQSAQMLSSQMSETQTSDMPGVKLDKETLDCAQNFLDQEPEIISHAILNSGVTFTPEKLLADKEELDRIQTYMADTMGVMEKTINLDAFLDSSFAKKISETPREN
jgi:NitT/TauT family transport system substrate-binding protein